MKRCSINAALQWVSGRYLSPPCSSSLSLSVSQSLFLSPFLWLFPRRHLPPKRAPPGNQHLRNAIWAFQRHKEKTNNAGKKTPQKTRVDKHAASWCWTNMSPFLPIHKRPCHARRSQLWKFKDKLVVVSGFVCSSCSSLHYCLTDFAPWGTRSYNMAGTRWGAFKKRWEKGKQEEEDGRQESRLQAESLKQQQLGGMEHFINASWPERASPSG